MTNESFKFTCDPRALDMLETIEVALAMEAEVASGKAKEGLLFLQAGDADQLSDSWLRATINLTFAKGSPTGPKFEVPGGVMLVYCGPNKFKFRQLVQMLTVAGAATSPATGLLH